MSKDNTFVERLQPMRDERGIYFLLDDKDNVVYIGSTYNLYVRILEHRSGLLEKPIIKQFTAVKPLQMEEDTEFVKLVEMCLICTIKPKLNKIVFDDYFAWFHSIPIGHKHKYENIVEYADEVISSLEGLGDEQSKH